MIDIIRRAGLAGAVACAASLAASPPASADFRVKATIKCNNRGEIERLPRMRVELREHLPGPDKHITAKLTDQDGRLDFKVDSDALENGDDAEVFLKLVSSGGRVRVWDWWDQGGGPDDTDTDRVSNHSGVADFGTQIWYRDDGEGTPPCALLLGAMEEVDAYQEEVGTLPYNVLDVYDKAPNAGAPYALYTDIAWPKNHPTEHSEDPPYTTIAHEFGHTIRHHFDGSAEHFAIDVFEHHYLQRHDYCDETNPGFAFNEGWAHYWAGADSWCSKTGGGNYEQEGDVAAKLALAEGCSSRAKLVQVLKDRPGSIHSLDEFLMALDEVDSTCAYVVRKAGPESTGSASGAISHAPAPVFSPEKLSREVMQRVNVARGQVRRLTEDLQDVLGDRQRRSRCRTARACREALQDAVTPEVLKAHLAQAKAAKSFAEETLATLQKVNFTPSAELSLKLLAARNQAAATSARLAREGLANARRALDDRGRRAGRRFRRGASRMLAHLRPKVQGIDGTDVPVAFALDLPDPGDGVRRARRSR